MGAWSSEREKLFGDVIARKLLADLACGKTASVTDADIVRAVDEKRRAMIGTVDRAVLIDRATKRLAQLAKEARAKVTA